MFLSFIPIYIPKIKVCRMLINRKNFCFTQIPDKTNESKNPVLGSFLTIFGHVCQMRIFSKKFGSVTHNYILAPSTILSLRKKLMSQVRESLWTVRRMDGRTDGRTDGQTLFYRTLSAKAKDLIMISKLTNSNCIDRTKLTSKTESTATCMKNRSWI